MAKDEIGIKVTLIGESSVGKTSIINRYTRDDFAQDLESTLGANYSQKKIVRHGKKIRLDLWDTAGQEKYRAIGRHFYKESYIVCLVYDITSKSSFENIKKIWYPELKEYGEKLKILALVGNKIDKYLEEEVKEDEAQKFADEIKAIYKRTSAMEGTNIEELFNILADKYLSDIAGIIKADGDDGKITIKKENNSQTQKKKGCC
jgi:Ras-related protein Rab-11A